MSDAYENALRTIADSYEQAVTAYGGKSLSRIATIVVSSGAFFNRLRSGATFSVANLEKFAAWFRVPSNWPSHDIPAAAVTALNSIGRPPILDAPLDLDRSSDIVAFDQRTEMKRGAGA